jgi:hypothetical protein
MRYREDKAEDRVRARDEVTAWRRQHPDGAVEDMLAAVGPSFHKDYGPVLRVALFRADEQRVGQGAETTAGAEAGFG